MKNETNIQPDHKEPEQNLDIRCGGICPNCKEGILDYDGLLNLVCSKCNYTIGGCFT